MYLVKNVSKNALEVRVDQNVVLHMLLRESEGNNIGIGGLHY